MSGGKLTKDMEAFFTRAAANEGIVLPLYTPDGKRSEHWVRIRGVDSDEFRLAENEARREAVAIASIEDETVREKAAVEARLRLIASLVIGWSFEAECTRDTVVEFLREAPQIADAIDRAAAKRALFFASRSSGSPPTPCRAVVGSRARKRCYSCLGRGSRW